MNNPYEEIYQKIMELSKAKGYATFDYLPDDEQGYPFVFVGEQDNTDQYTKGRVLGSTDIQVHVYAEFDHRSDVTAIVNDLLTTVASNHETPHFRYQVVNSTTKMLGDQSTGIDLWHGLLTLTIQYL